MGQLRILSLHVGVEKVGPAELLLLSKVGVCRLMMGSEEVGGAI